MAKDTFVHIRDEKITAADGFYIKTVYPIAPGYMKIVIDGYVLSEDEFEVQADGRVKLCLVVTPMKGMISYKTKVIAKKLVKEIEEKELDTDE